MTKIKIDSISQDKVAFGLKITFVDGKNKYAFFNTKKDGSLTKAMEQFKKYGYSIGDTIEAEVREEEKTFRNKEGKDVNYTQRTILYFQEIENTPVIKTVNIETGEKTGVQTGSGTKSQSDLLDPFMGVSRAEFEALEARVKSLEASLGGISVDAALDNEIKAEDLPF